ncbi:MAG: VWA-like domain-containing protein [Promethearchaeota archaeon]
MNTAEQRLANAKVTITINHPFFGYLLAGLEFKQFNTRGLTMATDGYRVAYSPKFLETLTNNEILFVLCHEVLHCALEHIARRKGRERLLWNIAIDIVTNEILAHNEIGQQPKYTVRGKQFLPPEFFKKEGQINKSAEEVYREVMNNVKLIKTRGDSSPNFDQHYDPNRRVFGVVDPFEDPEIKEFFSKPREKSVDWPSRLAQASVFAKSRGIVPLGVDEEYELVIKGQFPWQRLLAQYVQQTLAYDTTFSRPNRRFVSRNLYLPATEKSNLIVVIAIDTSGSISDREAKIFISEAFAILGQFPRIEIIVIQCDAKIQNVKKYTNWDTPPSKFELKGRGGTKFEPVFDYIQKKQISLDALIYLTDGYAPFPQKSPIQKPVFWVLTNRQVTPPFGRKIYFPPS